MIEYWPFFSWTMTLSLSKKKQSRERMMAVKNVLCGNKESNPEFSLANQKTVFASFCLLVQPAHNYHYFVVTCIVQYIDTTLSFVFSIIHCWVCYLSVSTIQPDANCHAV